ncbi:MAG: hypothetical protein ACT4N4_16310 [Rhodospirillales bacterium]
MIPAPKSPGHVGALALSLFHRWEPNRLFMIVTAYIDESGTDGQRPVMTMAGWAGKLGRWFEFEKKWRQELARTSTAYFRAKELWQFVSPGVV